MRKTRIFLLSFVMFSFFLIANLWITSGFAEDTKKVAANKERIIQTVRFLSEENFPRSVSPENKEKTIDFIVKSMADAGFEATRGEFAIKQMLCDSDFPSASDQNGNSHDTIAIELHRSAFTNIHALKKGKTDKRIVIAAHYDAMPNSPAADDNASGVAALIELAHLLKETDELNCNVELVSYDAEEIGLQGSRYHARKLKSQNVDVVCMISMDLIGYYSDAENSQDYPFDALRLLYGTKGDYLGMVGRPEDAELISNAKKAFQQATTLRFEAIAAPKGLERLLSRSDHFSFWQEGYPALFFSDTGEFRNKNYHASTDTWDTLDYDRLAQVPVGVYQLIMMIDAANAPESTPEQ